MRMYQAVVVKCGITRYLLFTIPAYAKDGIVVSAHALPSLFEALRPAALRR